MSSRFFLSICLALGLALLAATPVLAQSDSAALVAESAGLGGGDIVQIIGTIIKVFLGLLGIIFLLLVIYSGFLWMTSGGSDKQVHRAKQMLINATIGIVITLMSFAITSFVLNAILEGTGGRRGIGENGTVSVEANSGSLGSGPIQDHFPFRNQTDVSRNTNIIVTFREPIDPASLITGYDTAGTFDDRSDDTVRDDINLDNVRMYRTADGAETAISEVTVSFTDDLRNFVFNPYKDLGSSTANTSYTVELDSGIVGIDGDRIFTGANADGYVWSFETGVNIDTTAPEVETVTPLANGTYAKNIVVQITFNEAIDPTSASGVREATGGFQNIQVGDALGTPTPGTFTLTNGYQTVTFTPSVSCGTNSCGEEIFCLPGGQAVSTTVFAASPGSSPPQVEIFPYDGVVDVSANALDGNGDGTAGDDYVWGFSTTDEINKEGTSIESISPNISESDVALDQDITLTFSDILMASTVTSDNIFLTNKELSSGDSHEQWFRFDSSFLNAAGDEVTSSSEIPEKTMVTMPHGVFLESVDDLTYMYGVEVTQGVRNEYQNCYLPAEGPTATGGQCGVTAAEPYCCNGVASAAACSLF